MPSIDAKVRWNHTGIVFTAGAEGELVCFAHDVPWAYFNNCASIRIMVEP